MIVAVIAGAAGALLLISRLLPDDRFEPPEGSPMVARFRASRTAGEPFHRSI